MKLHFNLNISCAIMHVDPVIMQRLNELHSHHFPVYSGYSASTMAHLGTAHSHCPQHVRQDEPIKHPFNYSLN